MRVYISRAMVGNYAAGMTAAAVLVLAGLTAVMGAVLYAIDEKECGCG